VLANIAGRPIASAETLPIYRRVDELGVPLVLHPANLSMTHDLGLDWAIEVGLTWMWDTSAAALSLIFSGTLDECPSLTVLHPHLGGVIPYVLGRIVGFMSTWGRGSHRELEQPLPAYFRERFYVDTAVKTPGALALAVETYGLDRVLFASDFPFHEPVQSMEFLHQLASPREADVILHSNRLAFPEARSDRAATGV
jgi:predicted TIM-barrel fold metal-dependent hydrolase